MTKDGYQDPSGGTKKFLYSGPKKRGTGFEVDEEERQFNFSNSSYNNENSTNRSFDLDDVWSIKKNVNISKPSQKPGNRDGWSMNVGKGFYSRHGVLNDEPTIKPYTTYGKPLRVLGEKNDNEFGNSFDSPDGGKSRGQQKTFSYSYTTQGGADGGRTSQASSGDGGVDSPRGGTFQRVSPRGNPKGSGHNVQGGRFGVQNTGNHGRFNANNF